MTKEFEINPKRDVFIHKLTRTEYKILETKPVYDKKTGGEVELFYAACSDATGHGLDSWH